MNASTPTWQVVDSYPFRQPERVFFNPFNQHEMWVTSFGNGLKQGFNYPAGVNEIAGQKGLINVFPNPAIDKVTIVIQQTSDNRTLSISNSQGQEIINQKVEGLKTEIPINTLLSGIYFVKLISDNGIYIAKFVKE
jgi:hypothetical protein